VTFEAFCEGFSLDYEASRERMLDGLRASYRGRVAWDDLLYWSERGEHAVDYWAPKARRPTQPRSRKLVTNPKSRWGLERAEFKRADYLRDGSEPSLTAIRTLVRTICKKPLIHRFMVAYLGRLYTNQPLARIAEYCKLIDSDSVVRCGERIGRWCAIYPLARRQVEQCKAELGRLRA
jgi:hypothetical protein